jgi:hypothetical protein
MRGRRLLVLVVVTAVLVWLMRTGRTPKPLHDIHEAPHSSPDLGSAFDPARCGTIKGTVRWAGNPPTVPTISLTQVPKPPDGKTQIGNPNAPRITTDGSLAGAIVFLTCVEPKRSKPWEHPRASVEVTRSILMIRQGSAEQSCGIALAGSAVNLLSREPASSEPALHSIRGRGAAFFTQMLPVSDRPVSRELSEPGIVELSSGSGYYWLRAYLAVREHPYVAVTGADGAFRFEQVPDGQYEIHCWKANWHIDRLERDPESLGPVRLYYRPPVELRKRMTVNAGRTESIDFTLTTADFEPSGK